MISKEQVVEAVYLALDEVNQGLPQEKRLAKSLDTVLTGSMGVLDSLGVISMMVATEEKVSEKFDRAVVLSDEHAFSGQSGHFRTVGTLVDHVYGKLRS